MRCWVVLSMMFAVSAGATPALRTVETKYYTIHTDLPDIEAREAGVRVTAMVNEYARRTGGFAGTIGDKRLPLYLYSKLEDYVAAGGLPNSAGRYDGEKLMAVALRRPDDRTISLATWHVVQHEGFHQFADAVIGGGGKGGEIPMWANEGLGEYFGEALFTGDGFEVGLVPVARLARVRKLAGTPAGAAGAFRPLAEFVAIDRAAWNKQIAMPNYDQAWAIVHFLIHADGGRFQKVFTTFLTDVGKGGDVATVYARTLGAIPGLEEKCRAWWAGQGEVTTNEGYARATVAILASFAGRAHASGQRFASFDELVRATDVKTPADQWLPQTLFQAGVNQSAKMRSRGDAFVLGRAQDGTPVIQLTLKGGKAIVGRPTVKDGRVEGVEVRVVTK
ncbi:MAG TPA: DUF1570 domain-containing protein [Tepidisphaeraceae bacterium]|nr:DUF1570 domain-containing protein [Tepidisphaeraceae bacterium]